MLVSNHKDRDQFESENPIDLPSELPPVDKFELDLLPEALRPWIADTAERMQCPPDFSAVGALVALSSLIGARCVIAPKTRDDWKVVPNLWGLVVGRPSVMKSPSLAQVTLPLTQLEAAERKRHKAAIDEWELECKLAEMASKGAEKEAQRLVASDRAKARALLAPTLPPEQPQMRRYIVNDATVEKLGEILASNPWGVLVYRDELHGLLCSMDRPGQEGSRSFYLTGYDGNQGHAVDRIGRGEQYIERVCISMLGSIQPGKLGSYVREAVSGGAGDDGLLQRFGLAVWPDTSKAFEYVDRPPNPKARETAQLIFERLNLLEAAGGHVAVRHFAPDAQELYRIWTAEFEGELRNGGLHPALESHLSKYRKLIPALALVFACVDTPDEIAVQRRELLRAIAWVDYLRSHAERIYSAAVKPELGSARQLLEKIKSKKLPVRQTGPTPTFAPREVAVKGWAGLQDSESVRIAADILVDYGWLDRNVQQSSQGGGRPSQRYVLHPTLTGGDRE